MSALAQEAIFPKADWQGAQGFSPFLLSPAEIICWDQVGVSPAINILSLLAGQQRAANVLGSSLLRL